MTNQAGLAALVAAGLAVTASADLTIDYAQNGSHKFYYTEPFSSMTQEWNGTPFTITAEFELPGAEGTFVFPKCSWLGFWVDDTRVRERYVAGLWNKFDGTNMPPAKLAYGAVLYNRGQNIGMTWRWDESKIWDTAKRRLFMRAAYDGKRLALSSSEDGKTYVEQYAQDVQPDFKPNKIGLSLDSQGKNAVVKGLTVRNIVVTGDGPARSDAFDGKDDADWDFDGSSTKYSFPDFIDK